METILEHAVTTVETLSVFEKRHAQNVAREFLEIRRSGLTLPRLFFNPKAPLAERLQSLLSNLPQAQLEHFSATVAAMLEDETSAVSKPKPEPFVPEKIRAKLDDDSFHFADDHADEEDDEDLKVGKYASIFVEGKGWLVVGNKEQHQNLEESQPQQEEESGEDVAAVAAEMPVIQEQDHALESTDVEPISSDDIEPNESPATHSQKPQNNSIKPTNQALDTQSHELQDESAETATEDIVGDTSQHELTQDQQVSQELADATVADQSTTQPAQRDASSGSEDNAPDQPSVPQSSDTSIMAPPHQNDDTDSSSSKALKAAETTDKPLTHKRKAVEEPTSDGEVQSQRYAPRPIKSHKTGLDDFAGAPHAGPSDDDVDAPVPVSTQLSRQPSPDVQSHNTTSSSPSSSASNAASDESRRESNASRSTLATSLSASDGGRSPGAYGFSSHDLFRKGDDPHAKRFDRGTPIPYNDQVHAFCLTNNNPDGLTNHGFNAWLQIHGFDKDWLKYNFSLGVVHHYVGGTNGFQDGFYGPPNTGPLTAPPPATHGVQQAANSYQQPAYGQQFQPAVQSGTQPAQPARRKKTNASDVPPCTLEEIVRGVQNGRPKELKNDALNNFLRDYAPDMYKKTGENKAMLLKKVLNTRDVRTALQNAGLQVPVEYRVEGLSPTYNANSIGQDMSAMPTNEVYNAVGSSIADQGFGAQNFNAQNNGNARDNQQSQSRPRPGRGFEPMPSNRSRKPAASSVGGSMVPQAGINKAQRQARPSPLQRAPNSFLQAYTHQHSHGNLQVSNMAQNIENARKNSLPPPFEKGWAKSVTHVLQPQEPTHYNQTSHPEAIEGGNTANAIDLDEDESHTVHDLLSLRATPQAASPGTVHRQDQLARATEEVDSAALLQWNNTKHGDPAKMETVARHGRANPMLATNGAPKSHATGVSKKHQKKPAGAGRVASPQRAAQLARASVSEADFAGFDLPQNAPSTAYGGATSYAAPAAQGPVFFEEQSAQNLQQDQAQFGSDDTIDAQQDEEFEDQNVFNIGDQHFLDPQLFQPKLNNSQPLGQMHTQDSQISEPQPSMPPPYQPGYFNSGYADGINPAFTFEDLINNGDGDVFYDGNA